MLKPEEAKVFKEHLNRLKDTHSELTRLALTCPSADLQLFILGLSRLKDTVKCFDLISTPSDSDE